MACGAGGHFTELRLATKDINEEKYDIYWVTLKSKQMKSLLQKKRHHYVINVRPEAKWTWIWNTIQSLYYLFLERPDCIISTGSGIAYPTIFFGKHLFRSKIIYICSAADVTEPSRTPKQAYKYADLFCVQWPEMQKVFPKSIYIGAL